MYVREEAVLSCQIEVRKARSKTSLRSKLSSTRQKRPRMWMT
jgi:hypothetical protein